MKGIAGCLFLIVGLAPAVSVRAAAPESAESFDQTVVRLQKVPDDAALRDKIISMAATLKLAPVVPEVARRHLASGESVVEREGPAPIAFRS